MTTTFYAPKRFVPRFLMELIGSPQRYNTQYHIQNITKNRATRDYNVPDYRFWDYARAGRKQGLEYAGLFIKPLSSKIASYVFGTPPKITYKNKKATEFFANWMQQYHARLLNTLEETMNLGDMYIAIEGDLSPSVISPDVVIPLLDPADFSRVRAWRVDDTYPDTISNRKMRIVDDYSLGQRTRTKYIDAKLMPGSPQTSIYPVEVMAFIHILNRRSANEFYGRSEADALLPTLYAYNRVLTAGIEGNERQGRPTPVVSGMGDQKNVNAFWERYGKTLRQYDRATGTWHETKVLEWDADQLMTLAENADFKYAAPGSFASDSQAFLGLLFYLTIQHSEVPEFVMGNAISGSRASADTQLDPFARFISKKQGLQKEWLLPLSKTVLELGSVFEPGIAVPDDEVPEVEFEDIKPQDKNLVMNAIKMAADKGWIPDEDGLRLLPLPLKNPAALIKKAREEQSTKAQQRQQGKDPNAPPANGNGNGNGATPPDNRRFQNVPTQNGK